MALTPDHRTVRVEVVTPANTAIATPIITTVSIGPESFLERFWVLFPPGPSGHLGFFLRYEGSAIWPFQDQTMFFADDTQQWFDIGLDIPRGSFSILSANTDRFEHTLLFAFQVRDWQPPPAGAIDFLPLDLIGA